MAVQWTEQQAAAIENRGGTLLVSAAAGSGKTAVLVERILRKITDPNDPQDIDRFLIVTFTKAAAAEMRGKIADALSKQAAEHPENARLRRQLMLVHRAKITTVHAWCMSLVREHFHELGLAPDFRTADQNEQKTMRAEVLEEVLEALYAAQNSEFEYLADVLSSGRDDRRMAEVVLQTFEMLQSSAHPRAVLRGYRDGYALPFDRFADTGWGRELLAKAEDMCRYGMESLAGALEAMSEDETVNDKYRPAFAYDMQCADNLLVLVRDGAWDAAVEYAAEIKNTRMRLASVRGYEDKAFLERLKGSREVWKKLSEQLTKDVLCLTEQQIREDMERMKPAVCALCDAVQAFSDAYDAEKRRRNVVDFSDLEHFAVQLLQDEHGEPTALAREMHFSEIMVDEYQDTNDVQDAIFRAVSDDEKNIFMVGDVKQSIYRFRMAEPRIFLGRYQSYQDAERVHDDAPRRIVLSKNFRSRTPVLDCTNFLFSAVMSERLGDLSYTDREALYPGAQYPDVPSENYEAELCVLETGGKGEDGEESPEKIALEADYCAMRAAELLESRYPVYDRALGTTRPCTPSDIVILLRSVKNKAPVFQHALEARGVPAAAEASDGILQTPEVLTLCAFLEIVDNPRQDVPLLAVLRSPLIGWTEEMLARVRMADMQSDYYTALCAAELPEAQEFLQRLARLRLLAADVSVQRLLWTIVDETNANGIYGAMPGGALRQRNLTALLEAAGSFERGGSRGLFAFVRWLRDLREQGEDITVSSAGESGGFVRIMTIHKSKGLEFPVVILADCAKRFNMTDLTQSVLLHRQMGIGMKCCDLERGVRYSGADHRALASVLRRETVSEELRVLYVALTRAKEKLIITCALPDPARTIAGWSALALREPLPSYALASANTPAMWLIVPMLRHPNARALRELCPELPPLDAAAPAGLTAKLIRYTGAQPVEVRSEPEKQTEHLPPIPPAYRYPAPELADVPSKLTATALTGSFRAAEAQEGTEKRPERTLRRPFFDRAERGLTPSEIGTAHHMFLQFADFETCRAGGIAGEIVRLTENRTLTAQQGEALSVPKLERFFASGLVRAMMDSPSMRREFKFSVLVPAGDYYPEAQAYPEEQVLLQGVVDCMYETADGIVIVDFKTDRISRGGAAQRAEQYRGQLEAYARAVRLAFGKPVIRCVLFFLQTGQSVELAPKKNIET